MADKNQKPRCPEWKGVIRYELHKLICPVCRQDGRK